MRISNIIFLALVAVLQAGCVSYHVTPIKASARSEVVKQLNNRLNWKQVTLGGGLWQGDAVQLVGAREYDFVAIHCDASSQNISGNMVASSAAGTAHKYRYSDIREVQAQQGVLFAVYCGLFDPSGCASGVTLKMNDGLEYFVFGKTYLIIPAYWFSCAGRNAHVSAKIFEYLRTAQ